MTTLTAELVGKKVQHRDPSRIADHGELIRHNKPVIQLVAGQGGADFATYYRVAILVGKVNGNGYGRDHLGALKIRLS